MNMNRTGIMSAKTIVSVMFVMFLMSACAPSESSLQTAIAQTEVAVANTQEAWTETPAPTATATIDSVWDNCVLGKTITPKFFEQFTRLISRMSDNPNDCIFGVITKKDVIESAAWSGVIYNVFPPDKPITFLITATNEVILTTADVGDCIVVIGYADISNPSAPQFVGSQVIDVPQLTSELGISSSTLQEIDTLCK